MNIILYYIIQNINVGYSFSNTVCTEIHTEPLDLQQWIIDREGIFEVQLFNTLSSLNKQFFKITTNLQFPVCILTGPHLTDRHKLHSYQLCVQPHYTLT